MNVFKCLEEKELRERKRKKNSQSSSNFDAFKEIKEEVGKVLQMMGSGVR